MFDGLTAWWDALELWLVQRWFPLQFVLVMAVVVPLCVGIAVGLDRIGDTVLSRVERMRRRRAGSKHGRAP